MREGSGFFYFSFVFLLLFCSPSNSAMFGRFFREDGSNWRAVALLAEELLQNTLDIVAKNLNL